MERYVVDFIELVDRVDDYDDIINSVGNYLDENTEVLGWDTETFEEEGNSDAYACYGRCEDANKMEKGILGVVGNYNMDVDPNDNPSICIYYPDRKQMTRIWGDILDTFDDYDYDGSGLERGFHFYHPFDF